MNLIAMIFGAVAGGIAGWAAGKFLTLFALFVLSLFFGLGFLATFHPRGIYGCEYGYFVFSAGPCFLVVGWVVWWFYFFTGTETFSSLIFR